MPDSWRTLRIDWVGADTLPDHIFDAIVEVFAAYQLEVIGGSDGPNEDD